MIAKHGQLFGYQVLEDGDAGNAFRELIRCDECERPLPAWSRSLPSGGLYALCNCAGRVKSFRLFPAFIPATTAGHEIAMPVAKMDIIRPESSAQNPGGVAHAQR